MSNRYAFWGAALGLGLTGMLACSDDEEDGGDGAASGGSAGAVATGGTGGNAGSSNGSGATSAAGGTSGGTGASGGTGGSGAAPASGGAGGSTGTAGGTGGMPSDAGRQDAALPDPADGGVSPYAVECHGATIDCGQPTRLTCVEIRMEGGNGHACSNQCDTSADCSDAPSGAEAEAECIQFTRASRCLLVCHRDGVDSSCPDGMQCARPDGAPIGYCLWM